MRSEGAAETVKTDETLLITRKLVPRETAALEAGVFGFRRSSPLLGDASQAVSAFVRLVTGRKFVLLQQIQQTDVRHHLETLLVKERNCAAHRHPKDAGLAPYLEGRVVMVAGSIPCERVVECQPAAG